MQKINKNKTKLSFRGERILTLSCAQLQNVAGGSGPCPSPPPTTRVLPTD